MTALTELLDLQGKAIALHSEGKRAEAAVCYEQIIVQARRTPLSLEHLGIAVIAHGNLGEIYLNNGEVGRAVEQFNFALSIKPDHNDAICNLATARFRQMQVGEAIELYRKVIAADASCSQAHLGLAYIYLWLGDLKQAQPHYSQAIKLKPQISDGYLGLGIINQILESPISARGHYANAIKNSGDLAESLFNLAALALRYPRKTLMQSECAEVDLLLRAGHYQRAVEKINILEANDPLDPEVWLLRGNLLSSTGEAAGALENYARAVIHGAFEHRYLTAYHRAYENFPQKNLAVLPVKAANFIEFFRNDPSVTWQRTVPVDKINALDWKAIAQLDDAFRLSTYNDRRILENGLHCVHSTSLKVFFTPDRHTLVMSDHNLLFEKAHEAPAQGDHYVDHASQSFEVVRSEPWPAEFGPFSGCFSALFHPPKDTYTIEEPSIYIGGSPNFGHFLLDFLPKLYGPIKLGLTDGRSVYTYGQLDVSYPDERVPPNMEAAYALFPELNFRNLTSMTEKNSMSRFTDAIVPSYVPNAISFDFLNQRLDKALERNRPDVEISEKIYISRGKRSRIENEDEVQSYLQQEGFKIIDPFKLDFLHQAWLYRNARTIVTSWGSQATNKIFAKRGTRLLELRPAYFKDHQWIRFDNSTYVNSGLECHFLYGADLRDSSINRQTGSIESMSTFPLKDIQSFSHLWRSYG